MAMPGESREDKELLLATHWKRRRYRKIDSVGDLLGGYVKKSARKVKKSPAIITAWEAAVPEAMRAYCNVTKISGGVLTVQVSEGALKYEMQASKRELIETMLALQPKSGLKDIKFI
jgi:hypothetical protein